MTETTEPQTTTPLRALRESKGLSLREVSRRSEINPGRLSIIERGVSPTTEEMVKILQALDVKAA